MNNITFTNYRLAKIGYVPNDCGIESETVHRLFYECFFTNLIWTDLRSFWYLVSGERVDLTLQDVLLGKLVYLIGNNAAEGENYIKYADCYLMKCTVNNTYLKLGS